MENLNVYKTMLDETTVFKVKGVVGEYDYAKSLTELAEIAKKIVQKRSEATVIFTPPYEIEMVGMCVCKCFPLSTQEQKLFQAHFEV